MRAAWAIARREYASYFRTPQGWVVTALFLFLSGVVFSTETLSPGGPASLRSALSLWWVLLMIAGPALSMRLIADETRLGTLEPLMSAPAAEFSVIGGKYLGALLMLCTCFAPTLVYVVLLEALSRPDYGPIISGYAGVLLLGATYLAVGTLFSTITSSQTLAFLSTLFALLLVEAGARWAALVLPPPYDAAALSLVVSTRIGDFSKGVVDTGHVVFFVAVIGWLLSVASICLRVRRWR